MPARAKPASLDKMSASQRAKLGIFDIGDGCSISLVKDGDTILGLYFVPPKGGMEWHCANGDWGEAATEKECVAEIKREVAG